MGFTYLFVELFRRITGILLSVILMSTPLTGYINNNLDNPFITQDTYIDFNAKFISGLILDNNGTILADQTDEVVRKIICAFVTQFILGEDDDTTVIDALNSIPHEDYPHNENTKWDTILLQKELNAILTVGGSIIPEDTQNTLRMLADGINDLHIYFVDTEYDNVYMLYGSYVDDKGNVKQLQSGMIYDTNTGLVYGKDNNGIFGIGYNLDAKHYVVYTPANSWQKQFGFNVAYDILGELIFMDCETVRVKFDYDGKKNMVQFWKGNYTELANGAEIGIYVQDDKIPLHYVAVGDDKNVPMSMTLTADDKEILSISSEKHWWLSGFKLGPAIDKDKITMSFTIDFQDEDYAKAFCDSAVKQGITVGRNGSVVSGLW